MLSGLEAIHHNSIQGTAHETLTLGHSAWEAIYSAILQHDIMEAEHEATTCCLRSEADGTWKEMHEVMYNHQLDYDWQLATFLKVMETNLSNMRDQVWATVYALAKNEGITFNDCLSFALQVLNLLLQIPMDVSFQAQIPLTIAYCPESSIYGCLQQLCGVGQATGLQRLIMQLCPKYCLTLQMVIRLCPIPGHR